MSITLANLALGGMVLYGLQNTKKNTKEEKVDIYRQRDMNGLSDDTQDIIKMITFSDSTDPVGSFKYKVHKYPGDIDIFEPVKICCTKKTAINTITKELQSIAKKVTKSKKIYWGDFKAGLDFALKPTEGMSLEQYLEQAGNYLSPEEQNFVSEDYPENTRKFYLVRWRPEQILAGIQKLKSGKMLTLGEAITHDTIIKLDLWATVNGNYTEITNFFLFVWTDKNGKTEVLNAELADRIQSLDHDIEKYGSSAHWNPLKLAKRLWNKALYTKDHSVTKKLYPLFSSGAAQLNQIVGESETLRFMFQQLPDPPTDKLVQQIHGFKRRINDVADIEFDETAFYNLLQAAAEGRGNATTINNLLVLEDKISAITNKFSEAYLKKVGLI